MKYLDVATEHLTVGWILWKDLIVVLWNLQMMMMMFVVLLCDAVASCSSSFLHA